MTRWEYGHYDLPVARIDADGSRTEFSYDATRRLIAVTNPDDLVWTYTYNADGTLASETDFNNATTTYTYDGEGATGVTHERYRAGGVLHLRRCRTPDQRQDCRPNNADLDGETTEYSFDAAGRLDAATGAFGRWHTNYTAAGLPPAHRCSRRSARLDHRIRLDRRRTTGVADLADRRQHAVRL